MLVTLERLRIDAAKCADASLWTLSDTDLVTAVEQLNRLEQTLAAVKLHLVAEADGRDIPAAQRCRGAAAWLRSRLLLDAASARQLADLAAVLRGIRRWRRHCVPGRSMRGRPPRSARRWTPCPATPSWPPFYQPAAMRIRGPVAMSTARLRRRTAPVGGHGGV